MALFHPCPGRVVSDWRRSPGSEWGRRVRSVPQSLGLASMQHLQWRRSCPGACTGGVSLDRWLSRQHVILLDSRRDGKPRVPVAFCSLFRATVTGGLALPHRAGFAVVCFNYGHVNPARLPAESHASWGHNSHCGQLGQSVERPHQRFQVQCRPAPRSSSPYPAIACDGDAVVQPRLPRHGPRRSKIWKIWLRM